MSELDELAHQEEQILASVGYRPEFTFRFGDRFDPDDEHEWSKHARDIDFERISWEYAALLDHPTQGLEALKRGLFISWFHAFGVGGRREVEPANLVRFLIRASPDAEWRSIHKLEERIRAWYRSPYKELDERTLDQELYFMVRWYASLGYAYFQLDHFYNRKRDWNWKVDIPSVYSLIWGSCHPLLLRRVFSEGSVANRGLMGWYFRALLDEEARLVQNKAENNIDWMYWDLKCAGW